MKKILLFIFSVVLLLPMVTLGQGDPPSLPLLVYGNVTLYGSPAPIGTIVSIEKNNTEIARIVLTTVGKYSTQISSSYSGSLLSYKVGGTLVTEKIAANPTTTGSDQINLTIGSAPSSSGGGGGGGGSTGADSTTTTTSATMLSADAQKVDANKDNKIDVLDFNTLMVNWGKTEAGNLADFNSDGKVDIFDFNMLMINWTK